MDGGKARRLNGDHDIGMKFLTRFSNIARDSIPIWLSTKRVARRGAPASMTGAIGAVVARCGSGGEIGES